MEAKKFQLFGIVIGFFLIGVAIVNLHSSFTTTGGALEEHHLFWLAMVFATVGGGFLLFSHPDELLKEWMQRSRIHPSMPWWKLIASGSGATLFFIWSSIWVGITAVIAFLLGLTVLLYGLVSFWKALWHRAAIADERENSERIFPRA